MSLDVAFLKFIHHSKCHHLTENVEGFLGRLNLKYAFFTKLIISSQNKQQKAKVRAGDSWYVFYLSIKFVFLISLRLFTVSDFNFLICIFLFIKHSSASLLLDDELTIKGTKLRMRRLPSKET